jgi:hypothetical protein
MTEADFNQIRLIVTDAIAASEGRMLAAIAASEKRLSEGLTRAVVELDRRITDLEKRMIDRQSRFHSLELVNNDVKIRLAALEDRILNLETRRPIIPPAA